MTRPAIALVGDPVSHSASPAMQRAAFAAAGLAMDYTTVRIGVEDLADAFPDLRRRFAGLNVTRPLKEEVLPLLDAVSPAAAGAGSVNTVVFSGGAARGDSTDGAGFLAALARVPHPRVRRALILGTGGAARAVAAALRQNGATVEVAGRNTGAAQRLREHLGVDVIGTDVGSITAAVRSADLLVNATPVGAEGGPAMSTLPATVLPDTVLPDTVPLHPALVVVDLVYRPRRTALLERAALAGCRTVEGIEMLIEQGARSFELWTGGRAPVPEMRRAAYAALSERTT